MDDAPLRPPDELIFGSAGDFTESGHRTLDNLRRFGLRPDDRVLDIGCGIGRAAVPLTAYLSERGSYEGFDVSERGIGWCSDNITPRHPNFRFREADIYSKAYRPDGSTQPSDYTFPYRDGEFDFAFGISLFTHMLAPGTKCFVAETARVLRAGGRFLATFFLFDDAILAEACCGPLHEFDGARVGNLESPEAVTAHPRAEVLALLARSGFSDARVASAGDWWRQDKPGQGTQDTIFATRD
jgi:SAM-dependent methyltransferase